MAFTGAEKATLAEIAKEEKTVTDPRALLVDPDTETLLKARIVTWNLIKDSHVKLKGGKDGIDFDNERKRQAIMIDVRIALGLDPISEAILALDPNSMSIFELDVGSNFG